MLREFFGLLGYVPSACLRQEQGIRASVDKELNARLKEEQRRRVCAEKEVETLRDLFLQLQGILRDVQREARKTPVIPFAKVSAAPGLDPGRDYSVEVVFTGVVDEAGPEGGRGGGA